MNDHQRRVLGRVLAGITAFRDGESTLVRMLNDSWALFEASELGPGPDREAFLAAFFDLTAADDAGAPGMPPGLGSDADVAAALSTFEGVVRQIVSE